MSKFQIILLALFGFFILAAVLVFSLYKGGNSSQQATVTVWGTLPANVVNGLTRSAPFRNTETSIQYRELSPATLQAAFTEALAVGEGPDLIILPQDEVWAARAKLTAIPYASVSERSFADAFAEGGETFLSASGIYALPLATDPLVLYYNRDLLSTAGIAKPLAYWDEIYAQAAKLTVRDAAGNITQTAIALGETRNIANFKDILSLLFLQAGSTITEWAPSGTLRSSLLANPGLPVSPAESALDFYTQFANPSKPFYSWNRSLPEAQTAFASGDAAYYVGFASELASIKRKSPTLNFAVAPVPQSRVANRALTAGKIYGVALVRGSRNQEAALAAALQLVSAESVSELVKLIDLVPARRDLLASAPTDAFGPVFYQAGLQARGWLDPNPAETRAAFQEAVEGVTGGRLRLSQALAALSEKLDKLITK
jgi:ABC-type glycerol-3-phosphate transport system substrate-binding protein